jgi:hypothetical protein
MVMKVNENKRERLECVLGSLDDRKKHSYDDGSEWYRIQHHDNTDDRREGVKIKKNHRKSKKADSEQPSSRNEGAYLK